MKTSFFFLKKKKKENLILESIYIKEPKIKQISNQMISLNTEFEDIDKINPHKITIHSRSNRGIQLKSFNKWKIYIYIYIYIYILSLNHCILIMIVVNIESLSLHLKWKETKKIGKQNNLLKGRVAMRHSSYYAGVSGGVMSSETSTFMCIYTTYFSYNLLRKELTSITTC